MSLGHEAWHWRMKVPQDLAEPRCISLSSERHPIGIDPKRKAQRSVLCDRGVSSLVNCALGAIAIGSSPGGV